MSAAAYLLIALTLVGALWICMHVLVLWHAWRPRREDESGETRAVWSWRGGALALIVPPAAPVIAWAGRHRISAIAWGVAGVLYLVLWIVSTTV
jgi:hypothetical protein